jgi:hypothetical protein
MDLLSALPISRRQLQYIAAVAALGSLADQVKEGAIDAALLALEADLRVPLKVRSEK